LDDILQLNFSHRFDGVVWNTLSSGQEDILLVEVRNIEHKEVSFSALNLETKSFLWRDKKLEETWWINASAISEGMVIFTIYLDTNNPDKKGILAYSVQDLKLQWWNNDFSISEVGPNYVKGFTSRLGLKQVMLDLRTGNEEFKEVSPFQANTSVLLKPVQYTEGMAYFDTVKTFLADRLNLLAVSALEYLEAKKKIIVSYYITEGEGLANYLLVMSDDGNVILNEKLDGPVKGIGLDTFFVLKGLLIFVRNKVELVSYNII
jgi:hypothetical protein